MSVKRSLVHAAAIVAVAVTATANSIGEITMRIPDETVPVGGMVQMKVRTTEVSPISGGRPSAAYNPSVFEGFAGFSLAAPDGEMAGAAVIDGNHVQIFYSGTSLLTANYPILTISLPVRADAISAHELSSRSIHSRRSTIRPSALLERGSLRRLSRSAEQPRLPTSFPAKASGRRARSSPSAAPASTREHRSTSTAHPSTDSGSSVPPSCGSNWSTRPMSADCASLSRAARTRRRITRTCAASRRPSARERCWRRPSRFFRSGRAQSQLLDRAVR